MKVLIVDDSKAMRMIISRALKQAGFDQHTFVEANNGVEALEVIQHQKPDAVLSDWNMPEMNGLELLKSLRRQGNPITFGFVTTECAPEIVQEARSAGATFLINKPFTPEQLYVELEPILG